MNFTAKWDYVSLWQFFTKKNLIKNTPDQAEAFLNIIFNNFGFGKKAYIILRDNNNNNFTYLSATECLSKNML